MNNKRRGKFYISRHFFESDCESVKKIMGECLITRCEQLYHMDAFEYIAISDWFEEVSDGDLLPVYDFIMKRESPDEDVQLVGAKRR